MATVTFTISDSKLSDLADAMEYLYPIPSILDEEGKMVPKFTKIQWVKECVRKYLIAKHARYKTIKAQEEVIFKEDDNLIS